MKVTIGVPVYGVEKYIERCAVSLFEQSYENIEYVFVDDCTPDGSISVLKSVSDRYPKRNGQIRIVRHECNRGLAAARNTVVEHATGDFLLWVDSDDFVDKALVEKCVKKQQETDCDIVLFDFLLLQKNGDEIDRHARCLTIKERTLKLLARQTIVGVCGSFYRLSIYKVNGIMAVEGVNDNEDYQVSPRLSYLSRSVSYLDEPLYFYDRTNETSITRNFNIDHAEQGWMSIEILKDFFKDKGDDYLAAIRYAFISRIATYKKCCVLTDNEEYYKKILMKQKGIAITEILNQRLYKWPLLLINNFFMLKIYTKTGITIERIFCKTPKFG